MKHETVPQFWYAFIAFSTSQTDFASKQLHLQIFVNSKFLFILNYCYCSYVTLNVNLPITSALLTSVVNQASSPNFPNLYLDRRKSFGKPQATDTKCGLCLVFGSINVEKPLRNALDKSRVVQQIDCILYSYYFRYQIKGFSVTLNTM